MTYFKKIIQQTIKVFGVLFIAFLVYANWEKPPISAGIEPVALAYWQIENLETEADSALLDQTLSPLDGLTAYSVNLRSKNVSMTYHASETSEQVIYEAIKKAKFITKDIDFSAYKGPQCPVPISYIQTFNKVKYAFCFR
jgi:hypothetical protein